MGEFGWLVELGKIKVILSYGKTELNNYSKTD